MRGNPFNKLISVITGISSIVSIHAYAITLKNRGIEEELKQSQAKIDKLKDELHKLELGNVNTELVESKLNSNKETLNKIKESLELNNKLLNNTNSQNEIEEIVKNTSERLSESNKIIESILDTFSKKSNNFFGSDDILTIINNFYTNWNEFLSKLSLEQLGAVAHASSALFILFCLFNIMSIVYANFLLDKLKIEEKFPRIGKILRVRSKFVHFNLFINFSLIIFTLLGILYVNYLVFTL